MIFVTDARKWDSAVSRHPSGHLLQSFPWGELKAMFGWPRPARIAWGDSLDGGAQILFRKLPLGLTVGYVPKGPWWDWGETVRDRLIDVKRAARNRHAVAVIFEPNAQDDRSLAAMLRRFGLRPTRPIQPRSTIKVPLDAPEDKLLARMHRKTRYNIRLSARKGIVVREGSASDVPQFYELMKETSARDGFPIHSLDYYTHVYRLLIEPGYGRLLLAYYGDELVAGIVVTAFGRESIYLYGASGNSHRDKMPNHALQWAAMKWAKAQGCVSYDLWGVPDEVGIEPEKYSRMGDYGRGGLWGVYRFKLGFGGIVQRSIGAWIMDVMPAGSLLYEAYLRWRRAI